MRIDAHHHFWRYTEEEFAWIGEDMARIRRDFLPEDLDPALDEAGIGGVVTVQARTSLRETEWLLELYEQTAFMLGVVGWLPLEADNLSEYLDRFAPHPGLKGVREVVQAKPEGFLETPAFQRGIDQLKDRGLMYDLLIVENQLEEAIRFVDRHPDQPMVLDHIAKPRIREGVMEPWATRIRELARRPQVSCKLSGMVTEADMQHWAPEQLRPFFEVVLEAFGPQRLLAGSDWPVCLCGVDYTRWFALVDEWISELSPEEQAAVRGGNAQRIYQLEI